MPEGRALRMLVRFFRVEFPFSKLSILIWGATREAILDQFWGFF